MTPLVAIRGVRKSYGANEVLKSVDLDVGKGEVVCLIGRSGSGKTTLLRCINHLESVDSGIIKVDDEYVGYRESHGTLVELSERKAAVNRRHVGIVFQQFNLFPHMTVLENVIEGPLRVLKRRRADTVALAVELLERVGMAHKRDAYPRQLSGGQQQRVAIARALAMRPKLILFDEPTSALDPELVGEVLDVMRDLAADGMTMIVVTHELRFAEEVANRIVFMEDGRIVESGAPSRLLRDPQADGLKAFLSRAGFSN
ncbi:amino acid ABC transporter ATP-binding protein [Dactylosporangium sp. CA-139114]|uniref:amino acid ABC transporter ATP-binding protein n=1 Tax=Dactylosporangium sp. CA-139114 TaxID=3239931 RepID=UPI003D96BBBD